MSYSEEFSAGENAFEENESVFSSAVGEKCEDSRSRVVSVGAVKATRFLAPGDLVYARVENVYDTVALTMFQPTKRAIGVPNNFAYLRISEVGRGFVESFRGNLAIGDLLRARVKSVEPLGVYLTIVEPDLGVVKAFCSACRAPLEPRPRGFVCAQCNSVEKRKVPIRFKK